MCIDVSAHDLWYESSVENDQVSGIIKTDGDGLASEIDKVNPITVDDESDTCVLDKIESITPRIFTMWIKSFHINFDKYLPAYLQWRSFVDATVLSAQYLDESCGEFEVKNMISWQTRQHIKQVDERLQEKQRLHQWSNPMASNSHPEPAPVWIFGWPWENKPC